MTCGSCKQQYVGETKRQLSHRMNGHKSDIKLQKKSLPIVKHFNKCPTDEFQVTAIEKCRSRDSYIRKARESFYCKILKPKINVDL